MTLEGLRNAQPRSRKRKIATAIVLGCVCLGTIFLAVRLIQYLDAEGIIMFRSGPTAYYYPSDLKAIDLPEWHLTNAIPLTPDQAVLAAMRHLSTEYDNVAAWEVDTIELRKEFGATWSYRVSLVNRQPGHHELEHVRVLMNGEVWHPDGKRE